MIGYSVVIPVYNEEQNLRLLVEEIQTALAPLGRPFEVIAVDDGSTDGSFAILRELSKTHGFVKIVKLQANRGQSAAFDAGIQHANGEIIITMDADGQNDPNDIPALLAKLNEGYDVVTGWRRARKDAFLVRTLPSLFANALIRRVTGARIHDLGCSLKVYRASLLKQLRLYGEMHRYICPLLGNMGARIGEAEVHHRPRVAGVSKYGFERLPKVLLDLIYVWFNRRYQTKPMYVFGGIGMVLIAAAFVLGGIAVWEYAAYDALLGRNPLFFLALLFLLVSVQFFSLGLIAELLIRVYYQADKNKSYLVSETVGF